MAIKLYHKIITKLILRLTTAISYARPIALIFLIISLRLDPIPLLLSPSNRFRALFIFVTIVTSL